jgi:DNA repair exonuclease SbcCD ATPase subunit
MRLTEFEHVVTGPTQSLLRVCGQTPPEDAPGPRPVLVIETAAGEARFHPLRSPDDLRGVLRAAYAVPTALITGGAGCWLETSGGGRVELPAPVVGAGRLRDEEQLADQLLAESMLRDEPGPGFGPAEVSEADLPSTQASSPGVARDPADALHEAEAQIRSLAQTVTELERARDDDRRVAAAAIAQADTRAQSAEEREAAAIARAEDAEQAAQFAQSRVAALEAELASQAPAREALREEIADLRSRRQSLEREMDQSRDQLRLMTFERDELARQAAAFDEVAVKARERATAAEAANERATSTLDELQVWRAELERRLAETTTELGALRARRDADERELDRLRSAMGEEERRGGPPAGNGADSEGGEHDLVTMQAQEIQRLAAEVAELRSRAARGT